METIPKRYIFRNEHFGGSLLDRMRLTHRFLTHDETPVILKDIEDSGEAVDIWKADLSDAPKGMIYSPVRIYFELTRKCNLRCKDCFNQSGEPLSDELTTEEIVKTLEGLRKDQIMDVRFSGGELTTRADWKEVLAAARNLGFVTSVNTNGVYQNPQTAIDLVELDLDQITISVDGGRAFHNRIRGKGTFKKTLDSLKTMYEHGANLRVNVVLNRESAKDMPEILEAVTPYIDEINFFYMRVVGRAEQNLLDLVMTMEELHQFNLDIEPYKALYPEVNILHGAQVMQNNSISDNKYAKYGLRIGGPDGFTRFNILPDGGVWPGGYTPHIAPRFLLGNVRDYDYRVIDIWRESPVLEAFRALSFKVQDKCKACDEKNVKCPGASVEMELYRENNLEDMNPYCIH
jgi:MoaA/NifB/PqqE/SkfB family radical SAM enzyme